MSSIDREFALAGGKSGKGYSKRQEVVAGVFWLTAILVCWLIPAYNSNAREHETFNFILNGTQAWQKYHFGANDTVTVEEVYPKNVQMTHIAAPLFAGLPLFVIAMRVLFFKKCMKTAAKDDEAGAVMGLRYLRYAVSGIQDAIIWTLTCMGSGLNDINVVLFGCMVIFLASLNTAIIKPYEVPLLVRWKTRFFLWIVSFIGQAFPWMMTLFMARTLNDPDDHRRTTVQVVAGLFLGRVGAYFLGLALMFVVGIRLFDDYTGVSEKKKATTEEKKHMRMLENGVTIYYDWSMKIVCYFLLFFYALSKSNYAMPYVAAPAE
jgi:hypothetical protein